MIKKIILEIPFEDDFLPPDKFEPATRNNNYKSPCGMCPFYRWDDETAENWCDVLYGDSDECPIKKFF